MLNSFEQTILHRKSREDFHFSGGVPREGSFWLINFSFARLMLPRINLWETFSLSPIAVEASSSTDLCNLRRNL